MAHWATACAFPPAAGGTGRAVGGGLRFAQLSPGSAHSCGLATDGGVYCWGAGSAGQLGTGDFAGALEPVRVVLP